jgi:hypothetical protein
MTFLRYCNFAIKSCFRITPAEAQPTNAARPACRRPSNYATGHWDTTCGAVPTLPIAGSRGSCAGDRRTDPCGHATRRYLAAAARRGRSLPQPREMLASPDHRRTIRVFDLEPVPGGAGPVGGGQALGHNPLQAHRAGVPEHGGAVYVRVLVDLDPRRRASEEPRQARLALAQRLGAKILTIEFHEVKRLQDGLPHRAMAVQGVKDRHAVFTADHGLAIQGERLRPDLSRRTGDPRIAARPVVAAAGEQTHGLALPPHDQPVAVMLDLVHPIRAGRRLGSAGRDAGVDEAISADAADEHAG